jgi:hypothetical protein
MYSCFECVRRFVNFRICSCEDGLVAIGCVVCLCVICVMGMCACFCIARVVRSACEWVCGCVGCVNVCVGVFMRGYVCGCLGITIEAKVGTTNYDLVAVVVGDGCA